MPARPGQIPDPEGRYVVIRLSFLGIVFGALFTILGIGLFALAGHFSGNVGDVLGAIATFIVGVSMFVTSVVCLRRHRDRLSELMEYSPDSGSGLRTPATSSSVSPYNATGATVPSRRLPVSNFRPRAARHTREEDNPPGMSQVRIHRALPPAYEGTCPSPSASAPPPDSNGSPDGAPPSYDSVMAKSEQAAD